MPKVTFTHLGKTFEAQFGQSVLDVALENDIPMQHSCGGYCACATCHIHVESGIENISPMDEDEKARLEEGAEALSAQSRLGCQSKLKGDVVVSIINLE